MNPLVWNIVQILTGVLLGYGVNKILIGMFGRGEWSGVTAILLPVLGGVLYFVWCIKRMFAVAISWDAKYEPVDPASYETLDHDKLEKYSSELYALGFVHLADLQTGGGANMPIRGFDRIMTHPENGCCATLGQMVFPPIPGMACSIFSNLSDGYSHKVEDRDTTGAGWAHRKPKELWHACPGAPPEELLRVHLEARERIIQQLGLEVYPIDSLSTYISEAEQAVKSARDNIARKNAFSIIIDQVAFKLKPKREWMGKVR